MANYYVWNGASGSADGSSWANAYTSIATAITARGGNDNYFVAHDHVESFSAATTLQLNTHPNEITRAISVNRSGAVPPTGADYLAGAEIRTSTYNLTLGNNGGSYAYWRGFRFKPGHSAGGTSVSLTLGALLNGPIILQDCILDLSGCTNSGARILVSQGGMGDWTNCKVKFGATGQKIGGSHGAFLKWTGGGFDSGTIPTGGLIAESWYGGGSEITGVDLSPLTSNKIYETSVYGRHRLKNCKLHASTVIFPTETNTGDTSSIEAIACSSAAGVFRSERYDRWGELVTETTVVRTGGATIDGQGISWKMFPNYYTSQEKPCTSFDGVIWNDTSGSSKTLTVELLATNSYVLDDQECWLEVEYLGDANSPQTTFLSSKATQFNNTPVDLTSSSATWTTTGITGPDKRKLSLTFTPAQKGPIIWRVRYARQAIWPPANGRIYVCPLAELT